MPPNRYSRPTLRQRTHFIRLTLLCLGLGIIACSPASARCVKGTPPPQGVYEGCAPSTDPTPCIARLETIKSAGFLYVLNYSAWYGSRAAVQEYADAAANLGLKLIWPLNNPAWREESTLSQVYARFAEGSTVSSQEFTAEAINLVKGDPATWGFYIGDEVTPEEVAKVGVLSAQVRSLAPDSRQLFVSRPGRRLLKPFLSFVDVAGADVYPIGSNDPRVTTIAQHTWALTRSAGVGYAIVLQAFAWSEYEPTGSTAFPTTRQMQNMRDDALQAAHPQMVLWYSFQDILRSDSPARHWANLIHAAFASSPTSECHP